MTGLPWAVLAAALVIAFAMSALHSVAGFAFGLLSTPALLFLFPPKAVVVLTVLLMLVLHPLIVIPGRRAVGLAELRSLAIPVLLGLPVGLGILALVSPGLLRLLIGTALIGIALLMLRGWTPPAATPLLPIVAGFVGGVLTTSINFNGPPVALYLAARRLNAPAFRATIAVYLMAAHVLAVVGFALAGFLTVDLLGLAVVLSPACLAGYWVGSRLWLPIGADGFARFVLVLIAIMGVITVASSRYLP